MPSIARNIISTVDVVSPTTETARSIAAVNAQDREHVLLVSQSNALDVFADERRRAQKAVDAWEISGRSDRLAGPAFRAVEDALIARTRLELITEDLTDLREQAAHLLSA